MDESAEFDVGSAAEFQAGTGTLVECGQEPVAVFNVDGTFYALADTCSHGHASLSEGDLYGLQVECPWHLGRFDLTTGKACKFPAKTPVRKYSVRLVGERVMVSRQVPDQGLHGTAKRDDEAVA